MERDFPHRDSFKGDGESSAARTAQVKDALAKAKEMGIPLSLERWDRDVLDALGVKYERQEERFVLEPSGGIFEASDTLELGHDCVQTKRLTTDPIERLVVA